MYTALKLLSFVGMIYSIVSFFIWSRFAGNRLLAGELKKEDYPTGPFFSPTKGLSKREVFHLQSMRIAFGFFAVCLAIAEMFFK